MSKGNREEPAIDSAEQQEKQDHNSEKCGIREAGRGTCLKMRTWGREDACKGQARQKQRKYPLDWSSGGVRRL